MHAQSGGSDPDPAKDASLTPAERSFYAFAYRRTSILGA